MNDEIKEILARLSRYVITPDVRHDFDDLLDYITNLEQENERLKKIRNKAICYNKELCKIYDCGMELSNAQTNLCILEDTETLNILQNGSDENGKG